MNIGNLPPTTRAEQAAEQERMSGVAQPMDALFGPEVLSEALLAENAELRGALRAVVDVWDAGCENGDAVGVTLVLVDMVKSIRATLAVGRPAMLRIRCDHCKQIREEPAPPCERPECKNVATLRLLNDTGNSLARHYSCAECEDYFRRERSATDGRLDLTKIIDVSRLHSY